MKAIIFFFFVMISMIEIKAQTSAQLDINNINATVNTIYKPLFHDASNTFAGFEAPKGSGIHSIFASNLWIGGKDINDSLHVAIGSWGINTHDFIPGPIMDSIHYASQIPQWNRVWKIDRYDVLNHINNFNQPGYNIPQVFLDWPAHRNILLGQAHDLAPYFDVNNNGVYEPIIGEYPLVPGDQCVYYIFNDDTIHTESEGKKMGIEIHAFVYSFNCPTDSALMNTVFVKYKIINRSNNNYSNSSIGIFTDLDLGGSSDDFIGCNIQNGSYYSYNGDAFDDPFQGAYGYGDSLPAQSVTFLAGPFQDTDGIDNPLTNNVQDAIDSLGIPYAGLGMNYGNGVIDDERRGLEGFIYYNSPFGDPQTANDYYLYMNGFWRDSTHLVYGGSGHISSPQAITNGLLETNYMFSGSTDPLLWGTHGSPVNTLDWNETTAGSSSADRSGMGWTGAFNFESGSIEEVDLAYVFARDYVDTANNLSPITIMNSRIDDIRNYFFDQQTPCYTFYTYAGIDESNENISFSIFPNPSSNYFTLNFEREFQNLNYSIHDILGKEILSGKINSAQTKIDCENWSSGVYLIKVGNENGYSVEKVVVER